MGSSTAQPQVEHVAVEPEQCGCDNFGETAQGENADQVQSGECGEDEKAGLKELADGDGFKDREDAEAEGNANVAVADLGAVNDIGALLAGVVECEHGVR